MASRRHTWTVRVTLPKCTLCPLPCDPMRGIRTRGSGYYPLCDGCAPDSVGASVKGIADRCRATGEGFEESLTRFGHNEEPE